MERKYTALRIISLVYRILGGLALILAVIGAVVAVLFPGSITVSSAAIPATSDMLARLLPAVIVLVSGILSGLGLFAVGQMIQLLLDTEENTRRTAHYLNQLVKLQQ